jgi:hypothetical protein
MFGTHTDLAPDSCPHCKKKLDAATPIYHDGKPAPGDMTVCMWCAGICRWGKDMFLRRATAYDLGELELADSRAFAYLMMAQAIIKTMIKTRTN